jgi:hypothetical protein
LGVSVTAARDLPGQPAALGLQFWHGTQARTVELSTHRTSARPRFWLWNLRGSVWVTFDPAGNEVPIPPLFGTQRAPAELTPGRPPRWLTDLYRRGRPAP